MDIDNFVFVIGEEKVATVTRLFFFSFMTTFDNFCPSVRRPNRNFEIKYTGFRRRLVELDEGPIRTANMM